MKNEILAGTVLARNIITRNSLQGKRRLILTAFFVAQGL